MTAITRGGPSGAPPIVFLHGGVINRQMWDPVIDHLEDDYDCIAVDLPAHGDLVQESFTVDGSVRSVISTLDMLSIPSAAFVGLSLGGYVAQALAARHPDRASGLVLSGATIRYTGWDGLSTRLYGYAFPLVARTLMKKFAEKMTEDLGPELAQKIIDGGLSARGGAQALRRVTGTDHAAVMSQYGGPIVIANGERDTKNRDGEAEFQRLFPDADAIVIEDAGHACALQQPDAFAKAVRHLMETVS